MYTKIEDLDEHKNVVEVDKLYPSSISRRPPLKVPTILSMWVGSKQWMDKGGNRMKCIKRLAVSVRRTNQNKESAYQLECVSRISTIPIVETSWSYAGKMYSRIKNSNSLMYWTLGKAETSFTTALEITLPPTVAVFGGSINVIDKMLCKSLDVVEHRVPNIYLPPHLMYWRTKEYVSTKFVRPVLKRADSVKQMGNSVLESKYTAFAAHKLDDALNVADMYVDKYFPDAADEALDEAEKNRAKSADEAALPAVQTIHHVDRFSRKLQRRLTKRTLAEAKALKERSQESIHVLLYVAELIATDPKQALAKARELWDTLSLQEPGNQARPQNLEQLIVMLTRESARRIVHFVNFTRSTFENLPVTISKSVQLTTRQCRAILDHLVKNIHLEELTNAAADSAKVRSRRMSTVFHELTAFANLVLERLALAVAGHSDPQNLRIISSPKHHHRHHRIHQEQPAKPLPQAQHQSNNHHGKHGTQVSIDVPPTLPNKNQFQINHRNANNVLNNGAQS